MKDMEKELLQLIIEKQNKQIENLGTYIVDLAVVIFAMAICVIYLLIVNVT